MYEDLNRLNPNQHLAQMVDVDIEPIIKPPNLELEKNTPPCTNPSKELVNAFFLCEK